MRYSGVVTCSMLCVTLVFLPYVELAIWQPNAFCNDWLPLPRFPHSPFPLILSLRLVLGKFHINNHHESIGSGVIPVVGGILLFPGYEAVRGKPIFALHRSIWEGGAYPHQNDNTDELSFAPIL